MRISDIEHLFMDLLAICVSPLKNIAYSGPLLFSLKGGSFFDVELGEFFVYF